MGYLHYCQQQIYRFDDRTLAHLRTVISNKLLQQESFVFTWNDTGLQRTIWLHPSMSIVFEFESAVTPDLNREWLQALGSLANSPTGLRLVDEPALQ
ncbi:ATP-dependent DNA ligase [Leucobacter sp. CSA1]|uniref:ATP-dependent DNA ligase n=1 Tax=Leucobacter chromiisoli TaxID=2796471 RepID=A0A934Q6D5_9MICO|nr:ATP-dependent DNA ligase [Leucobacter chromiisoli]MBK0417427.1 ATP-dependent DNA ligase [Leucobacter chromiisoli]